MQVYTSGDYLRIKRGDRVKISQAFKDTLVFSQEIGIIASGHMAVNINQAAKHDNKMAAAARVAEHGRQAVIDALGYRKQPKDRPDAPENLATCITPSTPSKCGAETAPIALESNQHKEPLMVFWDADGNIAYVNREYGRIAVAFARERGVQVTIDKGGQALFVRGLDDDGKEDKLPAFYCMAVQCGCYGSDLVGAAWKAHFDPPVENESTSLAS